MRDDYNTRSKAKSVTVGKDKDPQLDFVVSEFEKYEAFHRERFENDQKIYDYWSNKPPKRSYSHQNAVNVPLIIEGEQTITPKVFAALFPTDAPVDIVAAQSSIGENVTMTAESSMLILEYIKHQFRVSNVPVEAYTGLTQAGLFGTGYMEVRWIFQKKYGVSAGKKPYLKQLVGRNECMAVDYFEMFPHPSKKRMNDDLPLIRRRFVDAEYIKKMADNPRVEFKNLSEALNSDAITKSSSLIYGPDNKPAQLLKKDEYELLEYWGPWDTSYKNEKEVVTKLAVPHWIVIVNRTVKILGGPNPYDHQQPPYAKLGFFVDPKPSWFGVGVGTIGKPTQERVNKIVNQRLDNVDLVLNKQGCYDGNDPILNVAKLKQSIPGQWHKVSDTSRSLQVWEFPDVTQSSYREEEIAKQDFRESTGATMTLTPTDDPQHRTAQGINMLQGAAGARFKPVLKRLESEFIQEIANMFISNAQQFMAFPETIVVTDKNGEKKPMRITPEQLQAKVFFVATGISEAMNKESQIGQILRFKELTMQDPTVNRLEVNRDIAELLGLKNIGRYFVQEKKPLARPGGLSPDHEAIIRRRIAEGATPEQVKQELLGGPPQVEQMPPEQPQDASQAPQGQSPQMPYPGGPNG
jgi:hypothetical protein